MDARELIDSAISALKANIMRTALTMLGIVIGISSVILIVSIGQGAVTFITNELSAFGTNVFQVTPGSGNFSAAIGADTLTLDDVEAIENDESLTNIESVFPLAVSNVTVSANGEERLLIVNGTTEDAFSVFSPDITQGEFLTEENILDKERVAVIGKEAVEDFFGENANVVGERIRIDGRTFRIIGVLSSDSALAGGFLNNTLFVPFDVVYREMPGGNRIQEIDISVKDQDQLNQTIEDVSVLLRDRHDIAEGEEDDFATQSFQDLLGTVQTITSLLTLMVAGISAISLVVGGVGVMNIMLVSVTERTKEIGLLKAIGARQKDILTQFLIEAMVMTFMGGLIGVTIGVAGAFGISLLVGIPFTLSIPAILIAVGVSTLVGLLFGLYPARRAARLNPIDALRYE